MGLFGSYGDLDFELINSPTTMTVKEKSNYPEHPRLESKPVLQWTSFELRTIAFGMRFHFEHCDPEGQIDILQNMMEEHEAYPLVMPGGGGGTIGGYAYSGIGVFQGDYVLETIDSTVKKCDKFGRIVWADVQVGLKECLQDETTGFVTLVSFFGRLF
jgi:phage protein U